MAMSIPAAVPRKDHCPPQHTQTSPRLDDPKVAQEDGLEDRFVTIFRLFAKARKCIVRLGLDKVPDVKALEKEYHLIAHEIDLMPLADKVDACRFAYLCERISELSNNPLGSFNRQAVVCVSGELEQTYAKLLKIYDEVLREVSRNSRVDLIEKETPPVANTPLLEFGAAIKEKGNFLGLLAEDPAEDHKLRKQLERQLSPRCFDLLNDRMREKFNEKIEKIKGLTEEIPSCFICYNTDEPDVKTWLRNVLVPDLWSIGVRPIWSGDNLYIGADIHQFEKRAKSEDFAIVICTPALHQKYTTDISIKKSKYRYSGVTREINRMRKRIKPDTTISLLFKIHQGKKSNEVNPFQGPKREPFAVRATLDNYAGVLKLFVALKSKAEEKDSCRTIAENDIEELKSLGKDYLKRYLGLQEKDPGLSFLSGEASSIRKEDAGFSQHDRQFFEAPFGTLLNISRSSAYTGQDDNWKSSAFNCTLFKGDLPFIKHFFEGRCRSLNHENPATRLNNFPAIVYGKLQQAKIYYELGAFADAISLYQEILTLKHDNYTAHCNLGRIYHILGELIKAEDRFVNAIRLSEANSCAYVEFGNFLMQQKRYQEAIECLKKVGEMDSSILTYRYVDSLVLYEELQAIIQESGTLTIPAALFAHFLLVKAYLWCDKRAEAVKAYEHVRNLSILPNNMDLGIKVLAALERDLKK